MTTKVKTERELAEEKVEDKIKPADYSCEILLEKTTNEKAMDKSFPTDAFIISYVEDDKHHIDVVRSEKMVNIFDMYYDKLGKGAVKNITYGHGTIRPNLWGVKKPPERKRKRKS